MGAVDILDIPLPQPLHDQRWTIGFRWREKEMNMIGHQTVGIERHSMGLADGPQFVQVEGVVALGEEAGPTIVAPLDQVK